MTQFFRHAGVKEEPDASILDLVDERTIQRARIIGAAIRVAAMVSAALPGLNEHTPIDLDDKKRLVLTLSMENAVLEGERLQKRLGILAKLLDRKAIIHVDHELA